MPDVAEFNRMFRTVEMTLVPQVPKDVRMRIQTARNLGGLRWFLLRPFRRLRLLVHHLHQDGALESISGD